MYALYIATALEPWRKVEFLMYLSIKGYSYVRVVR